MAASNMKTVKNAKCSLGIFVLFYFTPYFFFFFLLLTQIPLAD